MDTVNAPFIKVENLKYRYPHAKGLALKGVSFTVNRGEFIGIVGANKAGKSTLTQALVGLAPQFYKGAYGGSVTVNGRRADITPTAELCKSVGLVFQNPFNQLSGAKGTVYGEIAFGLQNMGVAPDEMKRRIDAVMELLDLTQYGERNPFDLSGGQMQCVAIASILVMEPEALALDEPTSQLDPAGTREVFDAVLKLAKAGKTIIMVEQKMELLAAYCDKILLMKEGEAVAFDTPGAVFAREDLAELGIQAPAYTRLAKAQGWYVCANGQKRYPVTAKEMEPFRSQIQELAKQNFLQNILNINIRNNHDMEKSGGAVFDIRNLYFSYGENGEKGKSGKNGKGADGKTSGAQKVITDLNLLLDSRTTAIIGQNGAGKTTLAKLLKGLLKPVSGTVFYHEKDISNMTVAALAGEVGYIFQNPDDQIFKSRVLDEVMFGPLNIGMGKAAAEESARRALAMVGLEGAAEMNPYDLELAERKMVAVASVIAMDAKVVIFDEPTIAQDYAGREAIKGIIRALAQQGKLVIAILHDMDFVAECFERVIVMAHGRILADGAAEEVFSNGRVLGEARLELPHLWELRRNEGKAKKGT